MKQNSKEKNRETRGCFLEKINKSLSKQYGHATLKNKRGNITTEPTEIEMIAGKSINIALYQ